MNKQLKSALFAIAGLVAAASQPAHAITQCDGRVVRIFSGDDGAIWLFLDTGGSAVLSANDPDKVATLSMAMTALVSGRTVTVRYTADNVACSSTARMDFIGMYLN